MNCHKVVGFLSLACINLVSVKEENKILVTFQKLWRLKKGRGRTGSNAGKDEWSRNGKGRESSSISDVRPSACVSGAGALLPAPAPAIAPSLLCCELPPCSAQSLLQPGWGKRQNPNGRKKGSFVTFSFSALWETKTELCHRLVACDSGPGREALSRQQSTKREKESLQSNAEKGMKYLPRLCCKNNREICILIRTAICLWRVTALF